MFFSPAAVTGAAEVAPVEVATTGWFGCTSSAGGAPALLGVLGACCAIADPGGGWGFGGFRKYQPTITSSARANANATRAWSEISFTTAPREAPRFPPHCWPH